MLALDATDVQILQLLLADGRMPNSALAARVGIAPSTCLDRVRSLRERGILRGFGADIDPAALGYRFRRWSPSRCSRMRGTS